MLKAQRRDLRQSMSEAAEGDLGPIRVWLEVDQRIKNMGADDDDY
jgi:hypothetical protein